MSQSAQSEICVYSKNGKLLSLTNETREYSTLMENCIHHINSTQWVELLESIKNILENKENKQNKTTQLLGLITPVIEAYIQYMHLGAQYIAVYYNRCNFGALQLIELQQLFSPFSFQLSQSLRNANFDFFVKQVDQMISDSKFESEYISQILSTMHELNGTLVGFNVKILQFRAELCQLMIGQSKEPAETVWTAFKKTTNQTNDTTEVNEFKNSVSNDPRCESSNSTPVQNTNHISVKKRWIKSHPSSPRGNESSDARPPEIQNYEMFGQNSSPIVASLPITPTQAVQTVQAVKPDQSNEPEFKTITYARLVRSGQPVPASSLAKPEPNGQASQSVSNCCTMCNNDSWYVHQNGVQLWAPAYLDVRGCQESEETRTYSQCIHNYFHYMVKNNTHVKNCGQCKAFARTYTDTFPLGNPCKGPNCSFLHMFDKDSKICLADHHNLIGIFMTYLKQSK
jgi:hypothetical protein